MDSPLLLSLCSWLPLTSMYISGLKISPRHLFTAANHHFLSHLKCQSIASNVLFCYSLRLKHLLGIRNICNWELDTRRHWVKTNHKDVSFLQLQQLRDIRATGKVLEKHGVGYLEPCGAFSYDFVYSTPPLLPFSFSHRSSPSPHLHFPLLTLCFLFCLGTTLSMTDPSRGLQALPW